LFGIRKFSLFFQKPPSPHQHQPCHHPPPNTSAAQDSVKRMERKFEEMCQKLEATWRKKEEEEEEEERKAAAEAEWRAKEAAERKVKEEAEAKVTEWEWMAEAMWKQHEIVVIAVAEQKQMLKELAAHQRWVSEKRTEGQGASISSMGPSPSEMWQYKRQAAAGCIVVRWKFYFIIFDLCFLGVGN
jgi:hypothetical protein